MNSTDRTRIACDCKVCNGRAAEVPTKMLANVNKKNAVHNLVCVAYGPAGMAGGNIRRVA